MVRSSSGHDHRLYQHAERADRDRDKYEDAQRLQLRERDIFKFLPCACMVHLRRLVKCRIDVLQPAQEDDHLITHTLPYAHDRDGRKRLVRAVDKWLGVDPEVCKKCVQDPLRTVDLHPQRGHHRQRHDHRHEECHFKIFLAVCRLVDRQREEQRPAALERHDDDHKFYRVQK